MRFLYASSGPQDGYNLQVIFMEYLIKVPTYALLSGVGTYTENWKKKCYLKACCSCIKIAPHFPVTPGNSDTWAHLPNIYYDSVL